MKRKLALKRGHKKAHHSRKKHHKSHEASLKHKLASHLRMDKKELRHMEHEDKELMKSIRDADHAERKRHKVSAKGIEHHSKHHSKAKHHSKVKHHSKKASKSKSKVEKVMREYKHDKLHSGSKKGPLVHNRKQAIAIALSEARRAGAKIKKKK